MCSLGGLVACGLLVNSKITVTPGDQTQIIFFFTPGTRLKVRKVSLLKLELSLPDSTDFITRDDFRTDDFTVTAHGEARLAIINFELAAVFHLELLGGHHDFPL